MKNFTTNLCKALTNKGFKKVEIKEMTKNNNVKLHAVLLFEKGDEKVTPCIYIDDYFEDFKKGRSLDDIVDVIILINEKNKPTFSADEIIERMDNKNNFKIMVVNAKNNCLDPYIHRIILNGELAEVIISEVDIKGGGYVKISKDRFPKAFNSIDELFKVAYENTRKECVALRMEEILKKLWGWEDCPDLIFDENIKFPMVVISNHERNYGASCLVHTDFLEEVANQYFKGQNMIIIPSSIHECICVPYDSVNKVKEMIYEVNKTELSPQEILSYEAFVFNTTTKKLNIAK